MVADFESYREFEERLGLRNHCDDLDTLIWYNTKNGKEIDDSKPEFIERIRNYLKSPEYLEEKYEIIRKNISWDIEKRIKNEEESGIILYKNGKKTIIKDERYKVDEDYTTLKITRTAFDKANYVSRRVGELYGAPVEIYMDLIGAEDDFIIDDILIHYNQEVNQSHCQVNPGKGFSTRKELEDLEKKVLGWGHSHGSHPPFLSSEDRENLERMTVFMGTRKEIFIPIGNKEKLTFSAIYSQNMVFNFRNDEPFATISISYEVLGKDRREKKFTINEDVDIKMIESTDSFDRAEIDRQILERVKVNGNSIIPKVPLYISERVPEVREKPVKVKKKEEKKPPKRKKEEPEIPKTVEPVIPKEAEEYKPQEEPVGIPYEDKTPVEPAVVDYASEGKETSSDYGLPTKHEDVKPETPKGLSLLEILSDFFIKLSKTSKVEEETPVPVEVVEGVEEDIGKIPDSYNGSPDESEEPLEEKAEETEEVSVNSLENKVSSTTGNQFLIKAKGVIKRKSKYIGAGIAGLALALSLYANYRVNALDHKVNNHINQPAKAVVYEQDTKDLEEKYSNLDSRVVKLEEKTSSFDKRFKTLEKQELTEAQKMDEYKRRIRNIEDTAAKGNYAEAKKMIAVLKGDINRDAKETAEKEAKISEQRPTPKKENLANVIFKHEVEPGDNLWKIVKKYLDKKEATNKSIYDTVDEVALFNGKGKQHEFKIGEINHRNPHYILPGQEIRVPRRLVLKDGNNPK